MDVVLEDRVRRAEQDREDEGDRHDHQRRSGDRARRRPARELSRRRSRQAREAVGQRLERREGRPCQIGPRGGPRGRSRPAEARRHAEQRGRSEEIQDEQHRARAEREERSEHDGAGQERPGAASWTREPRDRARGEPGAEGEGETGWNPRGGIGQEPERDRDPHARPRACEAGADVGSRGRRRWLVQRRVAHPSIVDRHPRRHKGSRAGSTHPRWVRHISATRGIASRARKGRWYNRAPLP